MPAKVHYLYTDLLTPAYGATLTNSPSADPNFPAINAIIPDRKLVWRSAASPPDPVDFEIHLNSFPNPNIMGGGMFNAQFLDPSLGYPDVEVWGGISSPSSVIGFLGGGKDVITSFGGGQWIYPAWRFRVFTNGNPFQIGKFMLGPELISDTLGYLYSPESSFEIVTPSNPITDAEGDPIDIITGKTRRRYRYVYTEVPDIDRAKLEEIAKQTIPFGLIDPQGNHNHVILRRAGGTPFTHQFGVDPGIWTLQLEMEQLP